MTSQSFVIVLMASIMFVGGGILMTMLVLEKWHDLRGPIRSASTTFLRRLHGRFGEKGSREKETAEEQLKTEKKHKRHGTGFARPSRLRRHT